MKLPVLAWCVMPNHFHGVVRPDGARDLSRWMHWVLTSHVQRHRFRYQTVGRIWQGRYKAFPIQTDHHLLTVLRYVERNPVTAGLVSNARLWRWSSHPERAGAAGGALFLAPSPVELPEPWSEWVDVPLTDVEMEKLQACASRGRPFGDEAWTPGTVDRLGLQSTVRPGGRPRSKGPPGTPRSGAPVHPG